MSTSTSAVSAGRTAALVGDFDRSPAYAGLADALTLLIGDGRIGLGARLPSERELTEALGVSRTTVTRAYAALRDSGYAEARQGSGTFTRVPGGRARAHDRALMPRDGDHEAIDLNCAAASAPPGVAAAYAEAAAELPAYFGGHGYFPAGLPELQAAIARTYEERGLPTAPEQVMVTPGALSAAAIVAQAFTRPGDRVLVESPVYPNATRAILQSGARLTGVPVDPDGWDLGAVAAALRQGSPRLSYLIPDFQNPTGHLMTETQREEYAALLRRAGTVAVVDEAHQALALDGQEMPRPFASFAPETITIGSASKVFWGGLRLGWVRAPEGRMDQLTEARVGLDLGAPVMEQLVLIRLLARGDAVVTEQRDRLREQRDRLAAAVTARLPEWRYRLPGGGQFLWLQLPRPLGTALTDEAERHGVIIAPGPVFAAEGGLDQFVRIPWTRPPEVLEEAVTRLAGAWSVVRDRQASTRRTSARVMVA
ncbi:GntR family transcriptional regulator [Nocardioides szechwanensis]|uniref:Transcriptional regulator, GntR family n=1 Tax=Nocardioides szechwanensis TaxID=1005944 RepID=A0A1G9UIZ5_9ACTN|nr:PLP-dependent aminotransferase family protein [Nocardioides szechwanensis]GEP33241.1 GntR family transcriptional regulator [Nocardioides szechwanensis]SDM59886.1 transcriptional regulator, GntR family [Nocardioides szechwanensis]